MSRTVIDSTPVSAGSMSSGQPQRLLAGQHDLQRRGVVQGGAHEQAREYQRFNSGADEEELAGVRSNMKKLIQKKLEMFPNDLRQIVGRRHGSARP